MSDPAEEVSDDLEAEQAGGGGEAGPGDSAGETAGETTDTGITAPSRPKWRLRSAPIPEQSPEREADEHADPSETAPAPPRQRLTGRRSAVLAAASAVLFVGAAAFAGATLQPFLAQRAVMATKQQVVATAVRAINTLWNYTPDNMDTLADRASRYLSGDLDHDYRKFIDAISTSNKLAKVSDVTEITGAAVETLDGNEAVVLVYTNTSATSEANPSMPSLKYQSHRLFMKRDHHRWVITKMPTITSLNLTPKL